MSEIVIFLLNTFRSLNIRVKSVTELNCLSVTLICSDTLRKTQPYDANAYVLIKKDMCYGMRVTPVADFLVQQCTNKSGIILPYKLMDDLGDELICKSILVDVEFLDLLYNTNAQI